MLIKKTPDLDGMNADTVDGMHAGDLLKKDDDTMAGKLGLSANSETGDSVTTSNGAASKGHIGTTGDENGALSINTNIAVAGTVDLIDDPALPSWRTVLDSDADAFSVSRAPAGTAAWVDALMLDAYGHASSDIGPFGTRSATLVVASSTASDAAKKAADYVCDGTGDEGEINAALNALVATSNTGTVQLSEGAFYLSASIQIPGNMVLKGQGMNVTIVTKKDGAGNFSLIVNASGANNITVKDLTLDGNRNGNSTDNKTIYFNSVSRPLVDSVEVRNMANDGMGFGTSCSQVIVNNCYVHDGSVSGIDTFATTNYAIVKNCRIHNIVGNGLYISGTNYASLTGNVISGCGQDGITVPSGSTYVTVSGNVIRNCGTYGVQLNSSYSMAAGNIVTGCANHNLMSQNSYNTVSGNVTAYSTSYGICSNAGGGNAINATGNLVYNNFSDGIVFFGSNNSAITGNNVLNTSVHGLYSGSSSSYNVVAGNLVAESSKAANVTYDNIVLDSTGSYTLVAGNKCYRGASSPQTRNDLWITGSTCANNTVMFNDFTQGTAPNPWISGFGYRKTHTLNPAYAGGWWVRFWNDPSHHTTLGDGTYITDVNASTLNWTDYNPGGVADKWNMQAQCTFVAPFSETYTFGAYSDDGVQLTINGATPINNWADDGGATYRSGTVALTAGVAYPVVVNHYENAGGEKLQVYVSSPSFSQRLLGAPNCYTTAYAQAVTDYQVKFTVHSESGTDSGENVYLGGCSSNWPHDIRFTNSSGTILSHFVEATGTDGGGAYATVWVKIDSISTSGATIYLFYGSSAGSISSASSTFTFYEDWSSGTIDTGRWPTKNGNPPVVDVTLPSGAAGKAIRTTPGNDAKSCKIAMSDYCTEMYMKWEGFGTAGPGPRAGSVFKEDNSSSANSYASSIESLADGNNWNGFRLMRNYSGGSAQLSQTRPAWSTGVWYFVQWFTTSNGYQCLKWNNQNMMSNDTNGNAWYACTSVGGHWDAGNQAVWTLIRTRKYVVGEPGHSTWTAATSGTSYVLNAGTGTVYGFSDSASLNRTS